MNDSRNIVNPTATVNSIAPLQNVMRCMEAMETAINRSQHLPGIIAFYGWSGLGKSLASTFAANKYRAYYVECKSSWTRKAFLLNVLTEQGIVPAKTIYEMTDQVSEQLAKSGKPLIVDEFDHMVDKNNVEIIRDIYEGSGAPILIIGEEQLNAKLKRWDRFHNRVLDWIPALPANFEDAAMLRELYSRDVAVSDDLLTKILEVTHGGIRRICVNLERVRQFAKAKGLAEMDTDGWGRRELFTGDAPARRF